MTAKGCLLAPCVKLDCGLQLNVLYTGDQLVYCDIKACS